MPKKRKNGLSPARVPMHAGEYGSVPESQAHWASGSVVARADSSRGYNNFGSMLSSSGQSVSQSRDEIIQNMQEMFSHLDPEVIYMVLQEADFKVENAMDSLLELSDAAEGIILPSPPVSGFEQAAALLGVDPSQTKLKSEITQSFSFSHQPESQWEQSPDETHLTREIDTLLDLELETLMSQQTQTSTHSSISSIPLSALPPPSQSINLSSLPLISQTQIIGPQTSSDLEQLTLEVNPKSGSVAEHASNSGPWLSEACRGSSPVSELSFGGVHIPEQKNISLDFSHLRMEAKPTEPRPSAFQVYRRPDQLHNKTGVMKQNEALRTPAMFWNAQATEFHPRTVGPAFITPLITNPTPWNTNPFPASQWLAHGPIRQAPLKPSATVPKSWTMPPKNRLKLEGHVLVLLRGAPGSGKTTLANAMLEYNPGGVVLSTDEYFIRNGHYHYERNLLGEAHEWNHLRANEAFENGLTPIIIDNTNMQCWEMKPYVAMAQKHRYKVLFREPDTWWKTKPRELEKRTRHQVTKEKIRHILERYDRFVSVQSIMNSQRPEPVPNVVDLTQTEDGQPQQSLPPGLSHPDLVGDSGLSKLNVHLSSSLPDLSSVSQISSTISTSKEGEMESYSSKEPMMFHDNILAGSGMLQSELLDGEELDLELDACLEETEKNIGNLASRTSEEFRMTAKEMFQEQPVAFSESIAQRARRDRARYTNALVGSAIDQPVDFDPNVESSRQDEEGCEDEPLAEGMVLRPELLDFVGDWPLESQGQRQGRRQNSSNQSVKNTVKISIVVEDGDNDSIDEDKHSDTDKMNEEEFQNLVDLLQGGGSSCPARSKLTTPHSPSLGENECNLNLETVLWPELPDCVQEWKFSECTDIGKYHSTSPSPATKGPDQIEESCQVSTQEEVEEEEESVVSEEKCRLSPSVQGTLYSRGGIDLESNLERRRGQGNRRTGKSCKLALTFTNQSLSSPCTQSPVISYQPSNPSPGEVVEACPSITTQTHPQDFALLWRINQLKCSALDSDLSINGIIVLDGNSLCFTPKTNEEQSTCQQGVPYRVVHEKGSQVEENDFKESHSKQHNLEILSLHFRHVSMDILEDLYEKCHQDMEWTTNLLLDSGERLYKDDDENEGGHLKSFVEEESHDNQTVKNFPITEPSEAMNVSEINKARAKQNVTESSISSTSSNSPKSQETNLSDLSQASEDWSTGQSSQSEAEGSIDGLSISKDKCKPEHSFVTLKQPTEDTKAQLNVPAASEAEPESDTTDQLDPGQEGTLVTQSEQSQSLEATLEEWTQEEGGEKEDAETRAQVDAITQSLLRQVDEMERREEEEERKEREKERKRTGQGRREPRTMDIQTLELKLPTELALQLTEFFGPVGVSPGAFSPDDCAVQIDLNLAKLLHQKWKETIQEKHRQAALSYQLLQECSVHWGESQGNKTGPRHQSGLYEEIPFMDHWSVPCPPISLRDIMIEEQVMQDSMEKSRSSRRDLDKKDSAAKLKENQLFSMFPSIDRHFLRDIFRDNNYSLEQTEQFLHALLDDGPVRNVVAPEPTPQRNGTHIAQSKDRRWKQRDGEVPAAQFQDTDDPEYEDFRTEAMLQRRQQIECFNKAAEANRQGRKDVASFYAQQGHMHGEKMREANHRAAMQIFERVNASLLTQNVLDLHGLHVDEALHHLEQVLIDKTWEWRQGFCRPQLSIITGRGNHSQGGVARIRPAVLDYLKNKHYSYTEPKTGLVLVTLH